MRRTTSFDTFPKTNMSSKRNLRNTYIYINIKHTTKHFLLILIPHDEGVFNDVYQGCYPPELQLKVGHSGTHSTFLNLEITVKDGMFVLKVFSKCDGLHFIIARMPYIDNNIPKPIIYSALFHKVLRKPRSSLLYKELNERAMELLNRIKAPGAHSPRCRKALSKIIQRYGKVFVNFGKNYDKIL